MGYHCSRVESLESRAIGDSVPGVSREFDEINSNRLFLNYRIALRILEWRNRDELKLPPSPLSVRQSLKFKQDSSDYSGEYAI